MRSLAITLLLLTLIVSISADQELKTISPLNLLLPASSDTKVEFPIEAFNGCYRFSSSDPSVISVTPIYAEGGSLECTSRAIARVEVNKAVRSIVWLTAEEESTGTVLRCESRVAEITRVEILTRLRTFDVGVFETIEVVGFDVYGNSFSTLEGLKFNWNLSQRQSFAEISTFKESALEATKIRRRIEKAKELSDQIVIKTKKIGKLTLEVELKDSKQQRVANSVLMHINEHIVS